MACGTRYTGKSFSTAYVPLKVGDFGCYGLVDSGAAVTLCSESILPSDHHVDSFVDIVISGVTGDKLDIMGTTEVNIKLGDFSSSITVYVVKRMADNVFIIGRDTLVTHECVIDYRNLSFTIGGHKTPLFKAAPVNSRQSSLMLECSQTVHIPPHCIATVQCHLKRNSDRHKRIHLSTTGAVEPVLPTSQLVSGAALVNVCNGKTRLHLINLSDKHVSIYRLSKVASFTSFSAAEINTLNSKIGPVKNTENTDNDNMGNNMSRLRWDDNIEQLYGQLGLDKLTHLSQDEIQAVKSLVSQFRDIFSENDDDLGRTDLVEHEIILDTDKPIRSPYYNIPLHLRPHAEKAVKQLMDLNIIEQSTSNYHSPSFLMRKPDGSGWRLLTDFRQINKHTIRSYQPIQGVHEMLALWNKCTFYSKMDFAKGFYQTQLTPDSRKFTATSIPGVAFFQYVCSPLGLNGSPTFFQSLVEKIFMGLKQSIAVCYLDDVLSASKTFAEMIHNLTLIFERIRISKMLLKPSKCEIFRDSLKFLGYVLSKEGVSTCPEKVQAMVKMAPPANIKGVRSFLGMTGFFRRFVPNYAKLAEPLTKLTKKNAIFHWNDDARNAWETIRAKLVNSPVLAHPDVSKRFTLITDASAYAAGAILTQPDEKGVLHPVCYGSTIFSDNQRNWSTVQRELYSLIYFCEKYQTFLLGAQFDVITDNTALLHLDKFKDIKSQRLWRWFEKLQKYDYKITYSPSKQNPSDALSRLPRTDDELIDTLPKNSEAVISVNVTNAETLAESAPSLTDNTMINQQNCDISIMTVKQWLSDGNRPETSSQLTPELHKYYNSFARLQVQSGLLYREWHTTNKGENSKWLICVPQALQEKVIHLCHDIPMSGHLSYLKTLLRIRSRFYFPRMSVLTQLYVGKCHLCHKRNRDHKTIKAPLKPYCGKEPGHIVHIDLMEALPKSNNYHAILICIDSYTKWTESIALRDTKAVYVARAFLNTWVSRQSVPCQLMSDRGGNVDTAKIIKEVNKMLNITKTHNYSYRPQTNAIAERVIGTIKNMLWKFCQENPKDWVTLLDQVMFAYRTSVHSTTGYSPFFLDKGRLPRLPLDIVMGTKPDNLLGDNYSEAAYNLYHKLQKAYKFVNDNIVTRQEYNKKRYDEKANVKKYDIGSWVYVWKPTPAYCTYRKFYDNYRGPFRIVDKVTDHGYKIDLGSDKYDVVHMEHLKTAIAPSDEVHIDLGGYYGDQQDPQEQSAGELHPDVTGNILDGDFLGDGEMRAEHGSDDGRKPVDNKPNSSRQLVVVPPDTRHSTRDRRQFTPYQHIV